MRDKPVAQLMGATVATVASLLERGYGESGRDRCRPEGAHLPR